MGEAIIMSVHPAHAQLLCDVLDKQGWSVRLVSPDGLTAADWADDTPILIDCDTARAPFAYSAICNLLRNALCRSPIIVLSQPEDKQPAPEHDFQIVSKPVRPEALMAALANAQPWPEDAVRERVERLLLAAAGELEGLQRNLAGGLSPQEQIALAGEMQSLIGRIQSDTTLRDEPAVQRWWQAAQVLATTLLAPQTISAATLERFQRAIASTEAAVRQLGPSGPQLAGDMHRLNGSVRRLAYGQGWERRVDALVEILAPLALRGGHYQQLLSDSGADGILTDFPYGLQAAKVSGPNARAVADLRMLCETHDDYINSLLRWAAKRKLAAEPFASKAAYSQVIVVEDDGIWRDNMIVPLLRTEFPTLRVRSAHDYPTARRLVGSLQEPSVVLVDLGLPPVVEERLGLKLLAEYATARVQDRYLVLTAAEDYEEVARQAIMAGVQPHDYILKDPKHWEEEVVTRLRAALLPRPVDHDIEVFACTARLIRIDGVEVELERKPFYLFLFLAENRFRQPLSRIVENLTSERYRYVLDLGEGIDEEKIARSRITDYVYDIREAIKKAFQAARRAIDPTEILATELEDDSAEAAQTLYYLTSRPIIHETFESIYRPLPPTPILVVEDDPTTASGIATSLRAKGLSCEIASTVQEAEAKIDDLLPRLVTLDLQLPRAAGGPADDPRGIEVLQYLKQRVAGARAIVFTGIEWQDAVRLNLLRTGVDIQDYLSKNWAHAVERLIQSVWRVTQELERGSILTMPATPIIPHHVHLDDVQPGRLWIDGFPVQLPDSLYSIAEMLAAARKLPVDRQLLINKLWPDDLPEDKLPDDFDSALNTYLARLGREIRKQTQGLIDPKEIIRGKDGVYWLQAIVA